MDIDKGGSMNDIEPDSLNAPHQPDNPSLNDIQRNGTINSIEQPDEYFQVVDKKQAVIGDQADFMKIFNELKKKDKERQRQAESFQKTQIKKKISQKKQSEVEKEQKPQEAKKERILKIIEPHVRNFKAMNSSNFSDTEVMKLRSQSKQKIFKFLLYGIEQLKQLKEEELNNEERRIAKLVGKDPYGLAKTLTIQIDIEFLNYLNAGNKQVASKKYKSYLKTLTNNIADETNLDLRRKILNKEYTPKKLATMNEEQYYPQHVREKLLQKQNALLRQATTTQKPVTPHTEQIQYIAHPIQHVRPQKKQQEKKPKYKYLQESSILLLRDFLKPEQIYKMRNLLQFDNNQKDIQARLVSNINKVFSL